MKNRYMELAHGRLKREGNRFGGEKGCGHDRFDMQERRRILTNDIDREFAAMQRDMVLVSESASVWTVLEPESGKYHSCIIIIEGDSDLAIRVYAARNGGRHPEKVSCDCGCGPDYRLLEVEGSLRIATAGIRRCDVAEDYFGTPYTIERGAIGNPHRWQYHTLEQFLAREDVMVIRDRDIQTDERTHPLPRRTTPSDYSEDAQVVAWLFDKEM